MGKVRPWQWLVLVAVVATVVMNVLANSLPLGGLSTGEISDRFDVLFVPAGYVFAIWGLIYVGLLAYAIYQVLPRRGEDVLLRAISAPFLVASAANVAWLFLWHYLLIPWSLLAMLTLLGSLIYVYVRVAPVAGWTEPDRGRLLAVRLPFSVYLGWISVATVANVTAVLDYVGWGGWGLGEPAWAIIMLGVATLLAAIVALTRYDAAYSLVLAWASVGIAIRNTDVTSVAVSAWTAAALAVVLAVVGYLRGRRVGATGARR